MSAPFSFIWLQEKLTSLAQATHVSSTRKGHGTDPMCSVCGPPKSLLHLQLTTLAQPGATQVPVPPPVYTGQGDYTKFSMEGGPVLYVCVSEGARRACGERQRGSGPSRHSTMLERSPPNSSCSPHHTPASVLLLFFSHPMAPKYPVPKLHNGPDQAVRSRTLSL